MLLPAIRAYKMHCRRLDIIDTLIHILQKSKICGKQPFHDIGCYRCNAFNLGYDLCKKHYRKI